MSLVPGVVVLFLEAGFTVLSPATFFQLLQLTTGLFAQLSVRLAASCPQMLLVERFTVRSFSNCAVHLLGKVLCVYIHYNVCVNFLFTFREAYLLLLQTVSIFLDFFKQICVYLGRALVTVAVSVEVVFLLYRRSALPGIVCGGRVYSLSRLHALQQITGIAAGCLQKARSQLCDLNVQT